jgi:DNA-binding NarL/FixJ family response regulator
MLTRVHPGVAYAVIADPVDRQYVAGAVDHGAVGVLRKPLRTLEVSHFIRAAHEAAEARLLRRRGTHE